MEIFKKAKESLFGEKEENKQEIETKQMIEEAMNICSNLTDSTYPQIDRMYEGNGKQWAEHIEGVANDRLENYSKLEHNFIADTVDRWTAFIGGQAPTIMVKNKTETTIESDVTPTEQDVELEENEAEAIQKIVWNMLRQNHWRTLYLNLAHLQSKYGRIIPYVYLEKGKHYPTIEVLRPHDTWPVFSSRNYQDILYVVGRKAEDKEKLKQYYGGTFAPDANEDATLGEREKVWFYKVLTDKDMRLYASNRLLKTVPHDYGRIPAFVAYNRATPFSATGKNDVEHLYRDQKAYNTTYSNLVDAIEDYVIGKRFIRRPGMATDMNKLMDRQQRHVVVGPETEVWDLAPAIKINDAIGVLNLISQHIEDQTGITELLKGRFSGSIATGVALSGLSRGIQDLAMQKIANLSSMLEEVFNFSLFLLKKYRVKDPDTGVEYSKILKRDRYYFDFIWDNASIQDERLKATTNIDMVNARLKSRVTAMKDMKINHPEDEQSRVSYETLNPLINPELAMQMAAQNQQGQKFSPENEDFKSKGENAKMLKGQSVEVTETDPGQHAIHLENHEKAKGMARGKAKKLFEEHMKKHKEGKQPQPQQAPPGQGSQPQAKGPLPGMGNEQVRPKAQPNIGNPQM